MNAEIKERITQIQNGIVPEGYKKTDVGVIPTDWQVEPIGNICLGKGKYGLNAPACEYKDGLPIYLRITDIDENGKFVRDNKVCVDNKDSTEYYLQENDILFARTGGTVGKSYLYDLNDGKLVYAGFLIKFSIDDKKIKPLVFKNQLNTNRYWKWVEIISTRSGQPGINAEEYAKYNLMVPSIKEQEKIADILEKWDRAIELQKQLIENLEVQKYGIVQRLITPKSNWERVPLKRVLKERKSYALKNSEFIHVSLTKEGVVDKTEQFNRDFLVSSEEKKYKVTKYNDICYNPANLKFGVICINKYGEAIFSPIYVTYEISENYNPDFIAAVLTSNNFINKVRRFEEGTVYERMAVKSNDFLRESILLPEHEEQNQIAERIKLFEDYILAQKQKLMNLKQQQKSMQQLLLTGIVRV